MTVSGLRHWNVSQRWGEAAPGSARLSAVGPKPTFAKSGLAAVQLPQTGRPLQDGLGNTVEEVTLIVLGLQLGKLAVQKSLSPRYRRERGIKAAA